MKTPFVRWAPTLFALAVLSGCRHAPPAPEAAARQNNTQPRIVLVGLDTTGSYALGDRTPALAAELFTRNAKPGDTWYFRLITRDSYSDKASISLGEGRASITLPQVIPPPQNRFHKRARVRHLVSQREFERVREDVANRVRTLRLTPIRGTDIWGFLAKAQDLQATDVVLFSDLGDTRNLRPEQLQLNGARVWILAFQSGRDPRTALKLRRLWDDWLRKAGASQVIFRDASQAMPEL